MSSVTEGYILNPEASTCACHPIQSVSNLSASMHAITLPSIPCPPAISLHRLPSNSRKESPATQERIAEPRHSLESWPSVSHPASITSRLLVDAATCHIALLDDGAQMRRRERDFERTGLDHPGGYTRLVSEHFTGVHSTCISSCHFASSGRNRRSCLRSSNFMHSARHVFHVFLPLRPLRPDASGTHHSNPSTPP
jgi:hypothetical protein